MRRMRKMMNWLRKQKKQRKTTRVKAQQQALHQAQAGMYTTMMKGPK